MIRRGIGIALLSLGFSSCALVSKLDALGEEPAQVLTQPVTKATITDKQWGCCHGLCGAKPRSVTKELDTEYLICVCQRGTTFRITKMAQATEYERL